MDLSVGQDRINTFHSTKNKVQTNPSPIHNFLSSLLNSGTRIARAFWKSPTYPIYPSKVHQSIQPIPRSKYSAPLSQRNHPSLYKEKRISLKSPFARPTNNQLKLLNAQPYSSPASVFLDCKIRISILGITSRENKKNRKRTRESSASA